MSAMQGVATCLLALWALSCNGDRSREADPMDDPDRPRPVRPALPSEPRDGGPPSAAGRDGSSFDASAVPREAGAGGSGSGGRSSPEGGAGSGAPDAGAAAGEPGGAGGAGSSSGAGSSGTAGASGGGNSGWSGGGGANAGAANGGGAAANGGASGGTAGSAQGGAAGGPPGGGGGGDPGPPGTIHIQARLASEVDAAAPATVGIVTFWVNAPDVSRAFIEFGLDESYGTQVEVDLADPEFRTLLLGMKPTRTYHFRVSVETSIGTFKSEDQLLETGAVPFGILSRFDVMNAELREPGFILGSFWRGALGTRIFVLDSDGEVVWFADMNQGGVARAIASMDGESIWVVSINNQGSPIKRVSWDALSIDSYVDAIGSHDIVAVEDDTMAYIDYGDEDCESVVEIDPTGTRSEVFDLDTYLVRGETLTCHGNALRYSRATDSYILSSLLEDVFVIPRDGSAVTRLAEIVPGGNQSWGGTQHGVHFLGDSMLIFANDEGDAVGGFQSGGPSTAIEYSLFDGAELWRHEAQLYSANLGDVQRLPGGNTLITYSNPAIIREVTPDGETVLELEGLATAFGYPTWRPSLYDLPEEVFTVLR